VNFKPVEDTAALGAVSEEKRLREYLLRSMDNNPLNNPEIWIANTAAPVHMTSYTNYLENVRVVEPESITTGNGSAKIINKIADVVGTINNNGTVVKIRITDVTILNNGHFNSFSISQELKNEWKLEGNKDKIFILMDKCQIKFDIKIKTTKGVLFATKIKGNAEFCGATNSLNKIWNLLKNKSIKNWGTCHKFERQKQPNPWDGI
jgi:hypothetical protein